ncbi:hypothetical protein H5410_036576 [Solanum commersonii]|uniref:Uncharacterized protein n=1 Tax=Solanum commersonii TaxID=4109 RepID=A0A9J5Y6Z4_SOLCO|nr:hypothetical protein H5410_036576 [Solanum commersonii]
MDAYEETGPEHTDNGKVDEISFMAIENSDVEEEEVKSELTILNLKEKMYLLSKRKLISMISSIIVDFQELTAERDQLFKDFAD